MAIIRKPRSTGEAQRLCERYGELDGSISAMEEARDVAIAKANAMVDADLAPLLKEREAIEEKLAAWWDEAGDALTGPKRKSIELGGCVIGTRQGRPKLYISGDERDVRDVLNGLRWAKPFLRVTTSLDKAALMRGLDGKHAKALVELGVTRAEGERTFYVQRTEQGGTQAKI
ncbi:MAG: host-nuclease inhibitor Gam family protein [Erythrobacter sp.]|jgi:phage host-nuclease inhibitor protein Gam|nr:host-nuclease inhibitor Gam family protein [Erythrobacter sp.]